ELADLGQVQGVRRRALEEELTRRQAGRQRLEQAPEVLAQPLDEVLLGEIASEPTALRGRLSAQPEAEGAQLRPDVRLEDPGRPAGADQRMTREQPLQP